MFSQTHPEEAFRLAEGPFVDRTPGRGEANRWAGNPGLVAALDAVDARHCVAAAGPAGLLEVVWGPPALTEDRGQDRQGQGQDQA